MKEYLLFVDTEASDLPKKWQVPYSVPGNWPHAIQISWLIFTKDGDKIKEENFYVNNTDFTVSPSAFKVHGLSPHFLQQNGIPLKNILSKFSEDLLQYNPMIVGHFTELDYHIIGAGYFREMMVNPMEKLSTFCIMTASKELTQNPLHKFLRLGQLYQILFNKTLLGQHNALVDATATAECFFELVDKKYIQSFNQPAISFVPEQKVNNNFGWILAVLLLFFTAVFLIACYYG